MFTYHDLLKVIDDYSPECFGCCLAEWDYFGCFYTCNKEKNKFHYCSLWEIMVDYYYNSTLVYFNSNNPYDSLFKDYMRNYFRLCTYSEYLEEHSLPF